MNIRSALTLPLMLAGAFSAHAHDLVEKFDRRVIRISDGVVVSDTKDGGEFHAAQ